MDSEVQQWSDEKCLKKAFDHIHPRSNAPNFAKHTVRHSGGGGYSTIESDIEFRGGDGRRPWINALHARFQQLHAGLRVEALNNDSRFQPLHAGLPDEALNNDNRTVLFTWTAEAEIFVLRNAVDRLQDQNRTLIDDLKLYVSRLCYA